MDSEWDSISVDNDGAADTVVVTVIVVMAISITNTITVAEGILVRLHLRTMMHR